MVHTPCSDTLALGFVRSGTKAREGPRLSAGVQKWSSQGVWTIRRWAFARGNGCVVKGLVLPCVINGCCFNVNCIRQYRGLFADLVPPSACPDLGGRYMV